MSVYQFHHPDINKCNYFFFNIQTKHQLKINEIFLLKHLHGSTFICTFTLYKNNETNEIMKNFPRVLDLNKDVNAKAQELGITEKGFILTDDQKEKMVNTFPIEVIEGKVSGNSVKMEIVRYQNEVISIQLTMNGDSVYAPVNQLETLKNQIK